MPWSDPPSPHGLTERPVLRLLGVATLDGPRGTTPKAVLRQPKRLAVLAFLALTPRFHQRDSLLALFWPELDEAHARNALSKTLHFLRGHLGDELIESQGPNEVGLVRGAVEVDVESFERHVASDELDLALALYRGDLLEGFHLAQAGEFDHWLEQERSRLRKLAIEAAWRLADQRLGSGNAAEAGRWARWAVARAPDDEIAYRRAIDVMGRSGDRAGALGVYEELRARLAADYDAAPAPETVALAESLRRSGTPAVAPTHPTVPGTPAIAPIQPTVPVSARPAEGSTRRGVPLALGALAIVAAALAVWGVLRSTSPQAVVSRYRITLPLWDVERGMAGTAGTRLALSRDGRRMVFVRESAIGGRQLWTRTLEDLDPTPLAGSDRAFSPFFSPDGRSIGYLIPSPVSLKTIPITGGAPIGLADSSLGLYGATWGPNGFIYASSRDGGLVKISTGGQASPIPMTTVDTAAGEIRHAWPEILPEGNGLLFVIQRRDRALDEVAALDLATGQRRTLGRGVGARYAPPGYLLYVMADGALMAAEFVAASLVVQGEAVKIGDRVAVSPFFGNFDLAASDGGMVIYVAANTVPAYQPVWVTRTGFMTEIDPNWIGDFEYPALAPGGNHVALGKVEPNGTTLWVSAIGPGGGPPRILSAEGTVNSRPRWSPDGRSIAFISNRGSGAEVYEVPADGGTKATRILGAPVAAGPVLEIEFDRRRRWLLYRAESPSSDIFGVEEGGRPRRLVASPATERMPSLSPDGRWLLYTSDETGRPEVFVRPFPETARTAWQVSSGGGTEPRWAHSGQELFYRSGGGELVVVPVAAVAGGTGGATFTWGRERPLFATTGFRTAPSHQMYDVAPDDQRFLMLRAMVVQQESEVVVIDNFVVELKARSRR